jgi:hypothetical protein
VILLTSVGARTGLCFTATSTEQQTWVKADRLLDKPIRAEQIRHEVRRLLAKRGKTEATTAKKAR